MNTTPFQLAIPAGLTSLLIVSLPLSANAAVIDVPGDQPTIQAGVDAAAPGDSVRLAAGTYTGPGNKAVIITKDLTVFSASGPAVTIIDCEGTDRAFLVTGASLSFEGLTIHDGNGTPSAIFCVAASMTAFDCVFDGNTGASGGLGGGAVFCTGSSVSFEDCTFSNNFVDGVGGGLGTEDCPTVTITDCLFEDNSAPTAGGNAAGFASNRCDEVVVRGCTFRRNLSRADAAALILNVTGGQITIDDTTFSENGATGPTGALSVSSAELNMTDCTFDSNEAGTLIGAVSVFVLSGEIARCGFFSNAAAGEVGAMRGGSPDLVIRECLFAHNSASSYAALSTGARVRECTFYGNQASSASVVGMFGFDEEVEQCTFYGNDAGGGAVLRFAAGNSSATGSLGRTILAGNTGTPVACIGPDDEPLDFVDVECCDVFDNTGGDWVGCLAPFEGVAGNFSADPLFCDPDNGDLTIRSNSPCAPPGVTNCGLVGAHPVGCGPVSVVEESWAAIKGKYR